MIGVLAMLSTLTARGSSATSNIIRITLIIIIIIIIMLTMIIIVNNVTSISINVMLYNMLI